jgi:rhodanese-related sulfurtransferase
VNVGLNGRFAEYVGSVLTPRSAIVLVSDPGTEREARNRLARVGFDDVRGALEQPAAAFVARPDVVERSSRVTAAELREVVERDPAVQVVDVRAPSEVEAGTIPGARPVPITDLADRISELDPQRPVLVYCAGGYRSILAASLLASRGFADVSDLLGGYGAWADAASRRA